MALAKYTEEGLLASLTEVFRDHGYDGASLARIMDATGLVKASLYHRFAGGKEAMAAAVVDRVSRTFAENLLAPLLAPGDPAERLAETGRRLSAFYGSGRRACLLDTLTMNNENLTVRAYCRPAMEFWISTFARFAEQCGFPRAEARKRAEDAVAALEGGLVVARVSGKTAAFERAIKGLAARLIA